MNNLKEHITKFNEKFEQCGFHTRINIYLSPFGGRGYFLLVPDILRKNSESSAKILDDYNDFIASNNDILEEYSLMIVPMIPKHNNKIFDMTKINIDASCLPYNLKFYLRTNEDNLIEMILIFANFNNNECPKYYDVDKNICTLYFDNNDCMTIWRNFLKECNNLL